ncbi:DUF4124 domain-containing protein [Luteimonas yindakuii]|uniref:DUF4124 domain-containing protein n=1 Tax=Luteimonas yindakuii TaxID=2565782 RepID=A0A4Z1R0L4_9GAMM|nr:DUF4124 domain-containing protein [Luteimonas yindakuii]QCO66830.1 DUF4124 domain-containing protein [Luteimonas yindakuii]TKS53060.1 DUF4124 domain-containing protein [Luteimonas yindakuii]
MSSRQRVAGLAGLLAILALAPVDAGNVIYRCTAADGTVTLQNAEACPAGQRQQVIEVDVAPPLPAFVPAQPPPGLRVLPVTAVVPPADTTTPPDPIATAEPEPPPPLYQCTRWDNERYLTEDAVPATRCRPLNTTGIGGLSTMGAGQACEQVEDRCAVVPEDNLCRAWKSRVDEAEFRFKVTPAQSPAARARQEEYAALAATYAASTCVRG